MRFTVRSADFYAARERLMPPGEVEDWPDAYYTDYMRIEAAGDHVRLSGPFGEETLAAQIEEPGVAFIRYREIISMTDKEVTDHQYGESDELIFTGNAYELCTQFWCCLIGEGDFEYFPDPATAPGTYTPPPPKSWQERLRESLGDAGEDEYGVAEEATAPDVEPEEASEGDRVSRE
ncbi:MAG: hypothetical protein AMXMBFR47_10940 [Planctomycetota bacterium]